VGVIESTYAEIKRQELAQNPYSCLSMANIDLNPHQVEAFVFALASLEQGGAILADEVGLGKTIEAGLVIKYLLMNGKQKILLIMPSNLRRQWQIELDEKFGMDSLIVDSSNIEDYRREVKEKTAVIIASYNFAARRKEQLGLVPWDFCVFDEAHRIRNVHKNGMKMASAIYQLTKDIPKIMLTATPMQNTLLDLYGLVQFIDDKVFYDKAVFNERYVKEEMYDELKQQLGSVVQRTLRSEVTDYLLFPERKEITVDFSLSAPEIELYVMINNYLKKEVLYALPNSRRTLITSVIRKLLASSSVAVAETFEALKKRLIILKESSREESVSESLDYFFAFLDDEFDEEEESEREELYTREMVNEFIQHEIDEVNSIIKKANNISHNAKTTALKQAISRAFKSLIKDGIDEKVVIFTESVRTQQFLFDELTNNGYKGDILMFNGNPSDYTTKTIYKAWKTKNFGKIIGSRSVEIKNAIVEAFREDYKILLVTDSGSEGLNLQFCNTVINYDLPWNPQKIEQRIGRCHRYGQKHDVVVINLLNTENVADRRIYEILSQKFELFQGVFGASDKAIGLLESGVDFEKRIAQIYQECKNANEFINEFAFLEKEIDRKRNKKMDALRGILSKKSTDEHKQDFAKILDDIDTYREEQKYWSTISVLDNAGIYPKYFETDQVLDIEMSHGYLILGGWYQDNLITSSICVACDGINVYQLSAKEVKQVLSCLTDISVTETQADTKVLGKVLDEADRLLYDKYCSSKLQDIAAYRLKMNTWLTYRKDEFLMQIRDTSEEKELADKYQAETNFKLKIKLKKQLEELQQKRQKNETVFQDKMRELEREASDMVNDYEQEQLRKPQLYAKIVVKY
jgi:ERCC4-related helicase